MLLIPRYWTYQPFPSVHTFSVGKGVKIIGILEVIGFCFVLSVLGTDPVLFSILILFHSPLIRNQEQFKSELRKEMFSRLELLENRLLGQMKPDSPTGQSEGKRKKKKRNND